MQKMLSQRQEQYLVMLYVYRDPTVVHSNVYIPLVKKHMMTSKGEMTERGRAKAIELLEQRLNIIKHRGF